MTSRGFTGPDPNRRTSRDPASRVRAAGGHDPNSPPPALRPATRGVDKRTTERIHISETTTTGRRAKSPGRDTPRTSTGISAGSVGSGRGTPNVPWNPEASLIPPTTAPLASRISIPPLASSMPASKRPPPLESMTLELQEASILEDLLFVFMGYEGQYIRFREDYNPHLESARLDGPQFRILPGLDPSLRDLSTTMLKMATHYGAVEAFVEVQSREEFGAVNHALCAAIRKLLRDYLVLVAQLEHQFHTSPSFTLHILHLHTLPTCHMMYQLYSLAREMLRRNSMLEDDMDDSVDDYDDVENILESLREGGDIVGTSGVPGVKICKGGSVLGLLTHRLASMAGDPAARSLLSMLLREASRPYMAMLNEWLHHGMIRDPHSEFLVKEQKSIRRERLEEDYTDEYWEKRYTVRDGDVPPQLEAVKEKVLLAGKYLNVVRECGGVDVSKQVADVPKSFDDIRFLDNVNSAYAHANESLLNLLLTTHALPARLRSLKHYFFLDRSDFFSYFLELGATELQKPAKKVNVGKLQSLLDLALRQPGSIAASDPFKEDVKVQMNEVGLTKWLMRVVSVSGIDEGVTTLEESHRAPAASAVDQIIGFNALELDYSVPFPLSLVISRKTVLRYQLLFRYLLSLRHLETLLGQAWQDHSTQYTWKQRSRFPQIEMWKRRAWTLRARMMVFVQQLMYFCTSEVVEPNWNGLMRRLGEVRTVDELMQDHVDFLDTCLKECMLTNSKLLKIHAKLMMTCTMFASYTSSLSKALVGADPSLAGPSARRGSLDDVKLDPARLEKLSDNLTKYEENFSRHLKILLDALNYYAATETIVLLGLCARLSTASNEGEQGSGLVMTG
ncbi:Spc98 family-domain-containing protein [Morchella snyderi]|nr:Spc98 family-domain-containing protein [Morchella snyderi]